MLLHKVALENVRSFLDRQEFDLDGPISIVVGPNGGGKTNLLDSIVIMLRRYLLATKYLELQNWGDNVERWALQENPSLNSLTMEPHKDGVGRSQVIELSVKVAESDLDNMRLLQSEASAFIASDRRLYTSGNPWSVVLQWDVDVFSSGDILTYTWINGGLDSSRDKKSADFLSYLNFFEYASSLRADLGRESLRLPMIYLPVNRASSGFNSRVQLSAFNDKEQKRQLDSIHSRSGQTNVVSLAIGRLARRYRRLLEQNNLSAKEDFYSDNNLQKLTTALLELGYEWSLETLNVDTNEYDVSLKKQGTSFSVSAASSGEKEILTYLFAIYALNVRDAIILIDEPELHLHPRWQRNLFVLFEKLSEETGNQFVMATHSPTFITPSSIQYVTRVYSESQQSRILRLNSQSLPNRKHLFNIINSQNNERIFFSDRVLLVEGLSDRILFEKILARKGVDRLPVSIEVVSVGGKGLFSAYKKILDACRVPSIILADRDYVEQVGDEEVKRLFILNVDEVRKDVIGNIKSMDGAALVSAIDRAIIDGGWGDAQDVWEYIKSKRIVLNPDLGGDQLELFYRFLEEQKSMGIYILSLGQLEDYLPAGFKGKDVEKLIAFLEDESFFEKLLPQGRDELESVVDAVLAGV